MDKKIYFTPGPSELYPSVPEHIENALADKVGVISHRSKRFQEIYAAATNNLNELLGLPNDYHVFFFGSATEIWERLLQNCVKSKSFHFVNGSFSKRFYEFSLGLKKDASKVNADFGKGFSVEEVKIPEDTEAICTTQNETSSGVSMPVEDIHKLRDKHPDKFIFVDAVSSLPFPDFDYNKIDAVFFSVQKCFGLPAGLGVGLFNKRCLERSEELESSGQYTGNYHSLNSLAEKAKVNQTPETPNVLNIYLLSKVTEDMLQKGIHTIREETREKAAIVYDYIEKSKNFTFAVKKAEHRSRTTIVANSEMSSVEVNQRLAEFDMAVGTGYGNYKEKQIRIANFPAHSFSQMQELVKNLKKICN